MSVRAAFCIEFDPLDQWFYEDVTVEDSEASFELEVSKKDEFSLDDHNSKLIHKPIGAPWKGLGSCLLNTCLLNQSRIIPGSEVVEILDNVMIVFNQHDYFFVEDIGLGDRVSKNIEPGESEDDCLVSDVSLASLSLSKKDDVVTSDETIAEINVNIYHTKYSDALGMMTLNSVQLNSSYNRNRPYYPIILEDSVEIEHILGP